MLVWKSPSCLIIVMSQSVINTTVVALSITRYSFQSFPSVLRSMQAKFSLNLITLNLHFLDIIFIFCRLLAYYYKLKLRSPVLCCACGDERCLTMSFYPFPYQSLLTTDKVNDNQKVSMKWFAWMKRKWEWNIIEERGALSVDFWNSHDRTKQLLSSMPGIGLMTFKTLNLNFPVV